MIGNVIVMTISVPDMINESEGMETAEFLSYLIRDKFPGKVLITTSLRARGMVTLRMVADIAPETPVVFLHMKNMYPESMEYKATIIEKLGLKDVRGPEEDNGKIEGDCHHSEALWGEMDDGTRQYTTIPLNETLKGFDCWISALYHAPYSDEPQPRLLEEGRLVRVNPMAGWKEDEVRSYLKERDVPFHPRAMKLSYKRVDSEPPTAAVTYNY